MLCPNSAAPNKADVARDAPADAMIISACPILTVTVGPTNTKTELLGAMDCVPGKPVRLKVAVTPLGPCGPATPCGPTGPCCPVAPAEPCGPAGPVCPCGPIAPAAPVGPVVP